MKRLVILLALAACSSGRRNRPSPSGEDAGAGDAALVAAVADAADAALVAPPAPADPLPDAVTLERLGWPTTTMSFELAGAAHVYASTDEGAEPLGKISGGTRLPVGASADGDRHCKVWLAVAPAGWVCARYARPSTLAPEAIALPVIPPGQLLPHDYYGIKKGAKRYASADDVRAGISRPEPKLVSTYMVTKEKKAVDVDGVTYVMTSVGLVTSSEIPHSRRRNATGGSTSSVRPSGHGRLSR